MAGPYFPPLEVAGQTLAFDHLEPFVLEMATQSRPNGVKIDVRFSNHCFSETFDAAQPFRGAAHSRIEGRLC